MNLRTTVLALLILIFGLLLLANNWIANWGKITIHADQQPLRDIVRSLERQGGVKIISTLEPEKPVTLHLNRASVAEALAMLEIRADASIGLTYFLAPTKTGARQLQLDAQANNFESINRIHFPLPFLAGAFPEAATDPRRMTWTPVTVDPPSLTNYLRQAAVEVEAAFFVPKNWNPEIRKPPYKGPITETIAALAKEARANFEECFFLTAMRQTGRPENSPRPEGTAANGDWRGGFALLTDPAAMAALERRVENQLAQLPEEERQQAREDWERLTQFRTELAELDPQQRAEKIREVMQKPEIQERMEERRTNREMLRSPEQRRDRYERRIERKFERKYRTPQS